MTTEGKLTIVGCGTGIGCLGPKALAAIDEAAILAGGKRLLELFPSFKGEKIEIGAKAEDAAKRLIEISRSKKVAVLASGDPMLYGIGGTFARLRPGIKIEAMPNVSAFQSLFARIERPWDGLRIFSIHGADAPLPWREMLACSAAALYCDAKRSASVAAKLILEACPQASARPAAIGEDLGSPDEKVFSGNLEEISQIPCGGLSVLALLPPPEDAPAVMDDGIALGLPDSLYDCDGRMISHPELRTAALSKLKIGPGTMWDVGAGSGSVGIEAALLCPSLKVFAVEKDAKRAADIRANALRMGASVSVVEGRAPEALAGLPPPRSVFIGGGGAEVSAILERCWDALVPGGTVVAAAALLETRAALTNALQGNCAEAVSISVSRSSPLGSARLMKAENVVDLFVYRKERGGSK